MNTKKCKENVNKMSMSFRPIVETDFEEILSMMKVFYASDALLIHPQEATLRRTLTDVIGDDPFVQGFAFEYEGVLAGYGMIAKSYSTEAGGHCVWIEDIYVLPEFRGRGIGTTVLNRCITETPTPLFLYVFKRNVGAIKLYSRTGFSVSEDLGNTRCIMRREVDRPTA